MLHVIFLKVQLPIIKDVPAKFRINEESAEPCELCKYKEDTHMKNRTFNFDLIGVEDQCVCLKTLFI